MGHDIPPTAEAREATMADADLLLAWRNDPGTRSASRSTELISLEDHRKWLLAVLDDPARLLLLGVNPQGMPVGTVRFDALGADVYEVSVTVAPECRGEGWAVPLLLAAEGALRSRSPGCHIRAFIRDDNHPSRAAFAKAGYLPAGDPASPAGSWLVK